MSRTLAIRVLSLCAFALAAVLVIGCSDHGKSLSEKITGGPQRASVDNGLSLAADPENIVIDLDDPNTPTDPNNGNKRYGETTLTAIALDANGAPQAALPLTFTTTGGHLATTVAVNTDDTGTAHNTLRIYEDEPDSVEVSVTDGTRTPTITVTKVSAQAPVADAGDDQTIECTGEGGTSVTLDGSGSTDANGDITTYEWFEFFGAPEQVSLGTGATLVVSLPAGVHTITLQVTDATGKTATDEVVITVVDTEPPDVHLAVRPRSLWPPNHRMRDVHADLQISDCSAVTVKLVSVTSSEPDNGTGDGDTDNDVQGASFGTDDRDFSVRAERAGSGRGRVYTLTYEITDAGGLVTTQTAEIRVPHDQGH